MALITREQLLSATTIPQERIDVPELGGVVNVRGMTGRERDAWEASLMTGRGRRREVNTDNLRAKLVVKCLVDEQGQRVFRDEDADLVGNIRVDVISRIFNVAQRLSGITDEDVEELGKPSEPETSASSSSSSPSNSA